MSSLKEQFSNIVESVFLASILAWSVFAGAAAVSSPTADARAARHGRDLRAERRRRLSVPACCAYWFSAASASSCASFAAVAQAGGEGEFDAVVERYVAEGLRSNLALQGESLEVERAAQALAAARARFFPEVSLQARYTRAEGGREFTIPLGTTLNPVYTTLNEMLAAQGQPAPFPQISDATVQFLREEEQDTRVVDASAAVRTRNSRCSSRAARAARCEQLQPNGRRARTAA